MKRRLNGKLLIILLVATAALGGGVHLLHGAQVRRSARALLVQADRAKQRGDLDKEQDYLGRYLAYEPGDAAALARLGRLREAKAETPSERHQAVQTYEKALLRDPSDQETRRRLVRLAVPLELFSEAKGHLEAWPEDQLDGELAALYGRCEEGNGRFNEAAGRYRQALSLDPGRIETYTRLADLLRNQLHEPKQADELMNAREVGKQGLIAANPKSAAALLARAQYRERYKVEAEGVDDDVAQALKLAPDGPDELLAAAIQAGNQALEAQAQGKPDQAKAALDRGIELLERGTKRIVAELDAPTGGQDETRSKLARMTMILSSLQRQAGRTDDAVKTLRQGAKLLPDDAPSLEWTLAELLIQLGRTKEATALIDGETADDAKGKNKTATDTKAKGLRGTIRPELIGYLDAQIAIQDGQWAEAAKILKESVVPGLAARSETQELTKRARLLLANCYDRLGDARQRYESARLAAAINLPEPDPLWVASRLELAAALVDLGRTKDALEQYRRVLPREPRAGFAIVRLLIAQTLRQAEAERDWKPVNQTLDQLDRTVPESNDLIILRAEALVAQNKLEDAAELIDTALVKHPDQPVYWVAKAGLAGQGGKTKEALAVLDEAEQRLGPRIEFAVARTVQIARGEGDDAAKALADLEDQAKQFNDADRDRLTRELGAAYSRIGRDRDARRLWTELAERRKDDLTVRLLLFDLAMKEKDFVAAERAIEEVERVEGSSGPLHDYGKARLLMARAGNSKDSGRLLVEVGELLARAGTKRSTWAQVPLAEAELALRNRQPEQAVAKYTRAVIELGDRSPSAVLRLLQLLGERGRYGQGLALVQELRKEGPISIEVQRIGAELAYRDRNYELGLTLLPKDEAARSTDFRDPLLTGLLLVAAKHPDEAEPLLRKAVELAPKEPKVYEALILGLAAQGKKDEANQAIQEAGKALPEDQASTALTLAKGALAVGDNDQAGRIYEAALKAHRDDAAVLRDVGLYRLAQGDRAAAEPLLREVLTLQGADPDVVATVKGVLADLAARGGRPEDARQALQVLGLDGKTAVGAGSPPEDLRAKAKVLAGQPGRARHREAAALLETLRKRQEATGDDLFLLAQLHEANGDWPRSRDLMLKLLNDHPRNAVYLARYIQGLLRQGQADEAGLRLKTLQKLVPDPSATVVLEARVLKAQGQDQQAESKLVEFAHGGDGRLEFTARQLEEIGRQEAAEAMYREAAKARPEAVLALAGYLGRRGKVKVAIDLIDVDQVWTSFPPEAVANLGVAVFYNARSGDEQQFERLARRIDAAVRQHPESDSLQFDLANLQVLQGRYADAEAVFRAVHERNKTKGAPLNNLAWLLAIQGEGRGSEALSLIEQAIELEGERADLLDTRGLVHLVNGQADLAVRDLEDAVAGAPPSAEMQYHLARAYLTAGKRAEAVKAFREAESLGLSAEILHPLERKAYQQVRSELARR